MLSSRLWEALLLAMLLAPCAGSQQSRTGGLALSILQQARRQVQLNHFAEARVLYARALAAPHAPRLSPPDALNYATALAATGDPAAAHQQLIKALEHDPHSSILNDAEGTLLAGSGDVEHAFPFFRAAVQFDARNARALFHLGTALLAMHDPAAAQPVLEQAVTLMPNDFEAQLQFGRVLSVAHDDTNALVHLHRALALRPTGTPPRADYALALALQASGDAKSARPLFDEAMKSPQVADSSALTNTALSHMQTGDAPGAIALYQRALAVGPDNATLREDFGAAYLQQADLNDAIAQFRAGLALEPDGAHLHYDLGLALKLKDDLTASVPEFQRAAELDPTLPDPPFTLGVIFMQQGQFVDAATQLKRAIELNPANGDAWALLGSVLKDADDTAGATAALRQAIVLQPDQPSLHIQLATLEQQAGDRAAAANDRKIAADLSRVAISQQRADFALRSGKALLQQNKVPEAIAQLNTAAQADPKSPEPHVLLADAYSRQGKQAEAAVERQRASSLAHP